LQELRVTQTGTQIVSGFLLTLVFQERFKELSSAQVGLYVGLVILAAATTAIGLAPVALHRAHFREHRKPRIVTIADRLLRADLAMVSALTGGVVLLIVSVAINWTAGWVSAAFVGVFLSALLLFLPHAIRGGV
jgi:hypothetical protein